MIGHGWICRRRRKSGPFCKDQGPTNSIPPRCLARVVKGSVLGTDGNAWVSLLDSGGRARPRAITQRSYEPHRHQPFWGCEHPYGPHTRASRRLKTQYGGHSRPTPPPPLQEGAVLTIAGPPHRHPTAPLQLQSGPANTNSPRVDARLLTLLGFFLRLSLCSHYQSITQPKNTSKGR